MKKTDELVVRITFSEIFKRVHSSADFTKIGINEWALNEGLAQKTDTTELNWEKAQVFMNEEEFMYRIKE